MTDVTQRVPRTTNHSTSRKFLQIIRFTEDESEIAGESEVTNGGVTGGTRGSGGGGGGGGGVFPAGPPAAPTALRNRRLCKVCPLPTRGAARTPPPEGKVERDAVLWPRAPPLHAPGPGFRPPV